MASKYPNLDFLDCKECGMAYPSWSGLLDEKCPRCKIRKLESEISSHHEQMEQICGYKKLIDAEFRVKELEDKLAKLAVLGISEALLSTGKASEILGLGYSDLIDGIRNLDRITALMEALRSIANRAGAPTMDYAPNVVIREQRDSLDFIYALAEKEIRKE